MEDICSHLKPYDEVDQISTTGTSVGGANKGLRLLSPIFPKFDSDPLDRLIVALRDAFSARYGKNYSAEQIKEARDFVAVHGNALTPEFFPHAFAYVYGETLDSLKKPGWLVEVFNKHLEMDDWPHYDNAKANLLGSPTVSSQKRTSDQAILEDRALGSISKRKLDWSLIYLEFNYIVEETGVMWACG